MTSEERRKISERIYVRSGRRYSEDDPIFDVIDALFEVTINIKTINDKLASTTASAEQLGKNLDDKRLRSSIKQLESFVDLVSNFSSKLYIIAFIGGLLSAGLPTYMLYRKTVQAFEQENAIRIDKELSELYDRSDRLYALGTEAAKDGVFLEYQKAEHKSILYGVFTFKNKVYLSKDGTAIWMPLAIDADR